jgi:hypothetical protein
MKQNDIRNSAQSLISRKWGGTQVLPRDNQSKHHLPRPSGRPRACPTITHHERPTARVRFFELGPFLEGLRVLSFFFLGQQAWSAFPTRTLAMFARRLESRSRSSLTWTVPAERLCLRSVVRTSPEFRSRSLLPRLPVVGLASASLRSDASRFPVKEHRKDTTIGARFLLAFRCLFTR